MTARRTFLTLGAILALGGPARAAQIAVDPPGLNAAAKVAKPGDVLLLAPGATYAGVLVQNVSGVTLRSADPARPARLTAAVFKGTTGLTLADLELDATASKDPYAFRFVATHGTRLKGVRVHGSMDGNPGNDVSGLLIDGGGDFGLADSTFEELAFGIVHQNVDTATITGSTFRNLRSDGIHGSAGQHFTISGNVFAGFHPAPADHPDAVQFFPTPAGVVASDVLIEGNVVLRGDGAPIEGFFFRSLPTMQRFQRITIRDNFLAGLQFNGITVLYGDDIAISGNTVVALPGADSWIRLENTNRASLKDNRAFKFVVSAANSNLTNTGSAVLPRALDAAPLLAGWLTRPGTLAWRLGAYLPTDPN